MKIFFYSTTFAPSVGGIEVLVETLCRQFIALGHEVRVATETPGRADVPFPVHRQPPRGRFVELVSWCDIHVQANVALKAAWIWPLAPHKILYQHNNVYQRDDGTKRPLDQIKTALARVTPGIANSSYTAERTGARHVILNAYDDATFGPPRDWGDKDRDLVFLGRLVSQKGCDLLLDALGRLAARGRRPALTIIGDGPDKTALEQQVASLGIDGQVVFLGKLTGQTLADELRRHRVMVVPSRYEEPFGIVALEGLASGCIPVVSERGGLTDAIGEHGFTFRNGDAGALADRLEAVLEDTEGARARLNGVEAHLEQCRARTVAERYLEVFEHHIGKRA